MSARESEDSDDWDALVEINARTLIADTSAEADALQVRAHVPSPLATQVLSNIYILVLTYLFKLMFVRIFSQKTNGHHQPESTIQASGMRSARPESDVIESDARRRGDAATRSDECVVAETPTDNSEHAPSVFHVVRAQFESKSGSGLFDCVCTCIDCNS